MGVRERTIAVVAVVVVSVSIALYVIVSAAIERELKRLEVFEVRSTIYRVNEALDHETEHLGRSAIDWATWDDTYRFVSTGDMESFASNLDGTALVALNADFMAFYDASGESVGSVSLDVDTGTLKSPAPGVSARLKTQASMFDTVSEDEGVSGILTFAQGPALISAQPIRRSDGSGPSAGTFVIGAFIRDSHESRISDLVGAQVELRRPRDADERRTWSSLAEGTQYLVEPVSDREVRGYSLHRGLDDSNALMTSVTQPRTSVMLARETRRALVPPAIGTVMALILALFFALDRFVLRRLAMLGAEVRSVTRGADPERRVRISGSDEIAALAQDVNRMLVALNESRRAVMSKQKQLSELSVQLVETEERERRSIAVALHDNVAQTLAAAAIQLGMARKVKPAEAHEHHLAQADKLIGEAMRETRNLVPQLTSSALNELGLASGIKNFVERTIEPAGINVSIDIAVQVEDMSEPTLAFLYRTARELLINTLKHASASSATVRCWCEDDLVFLTVEDDGGGFDASAACKGYGLLSIGEQARSTGADFEIRSKPGGGTIASISVARPAVS